MGIFSSWTGSQKGQKSDRPTLGLCSSKPGILGVWIGWNESRFPTEVYRIVIKLFDSFRNLPGESCSFTFAPAKTKPFVQYLELPCPFKEFLRGRDRAKAGEIVFEVFLSESQTFSRLFELEEVLSCYLGKGKNTPSFVETLSGLQEADDPKLASIPHSDLKAHSEKVKAALEEKRRKAEEEAQAREAARLEAEKKAAQAKAEAAAKAASAAKPGAAEDPNKPTLTGKVAIIYGTSTGNTGNVAQLIKAELGEAVHHCISVTELKPIDFTVPDILILGVPTWHIGEMQDDWAAALPQIGQQDYKGKRVAIFGLGDGKGYPDTYVDAMAELLEKFETKGAKLYGLWPTTGYDFKASKAIRDGKFLGLVIDVENQDNLTEERVKAWTAQIRRELAL